MSEFRGFAIAEKYAPLIFINSSDAHSAKIFTLIHELAHLWVDQSGISNIDLKEEISNKEEQFCNAVSAEVLVPKAEFIKIWNQGASVEDNSENTSLHFKVSKFVVARKALDIGFIKHKQFFDYYDAENERFEKYRQLRRGKKSSGGNPFANTWSRNGRRFSMAITQSALANTLLLRDAGAYLNMNPNNVLKFADALGVR